MNSQNVSSLVEELKAKISGEIKFDESTLLMYSTDASAYREKPLFVVYPKDDSDIKNLILFARSNKCSLIPRTAGTSLAGQVVGNGIIVDLSTHFNEVLEFNQEERWIRVRPGVVLDELNKSLQPYKLFFGPETSTSNRCMIGGMVGNNSCGAHSLIYGSTRDHTLQVEGYLSDGSFVSFEALSREEFNKKLDLNTFEGELYRHINALLSQEEVRKEIISNYPHPEIERRNTGYALDLLLNCELFSESEERFNFCKLIAGSEGTLFFITAIKLNLVDTPPSEVALSCVHTHTVSEALHANLIALKHSPASIELMDKTLMDLTKENIEQSKNRFFVKGDPGAILIVEFVGDSKEEIKLKAEALERELRETGFGYEFPVVYGSDVKRVWNLRKAGLGILQNMPGDAKPVPVIEDTAVRPIDMPDYIADFDKMLESMQLSCVYYAHIATGELHLRPVLNLKSAEGVDKFRRVAEETARLVKKYNGSLSGEHGDGRLRGEFIPMMIGRKNYGYLVDLKKKWDPEGVFNPGKITDTPAMDTSLRFSADHKHKDLKTFYNFDKDQGFLRAVERCNGSGDCRKSSIIGGTMCPSFMATRLEHNTTRARANILREFITKSTKQNPFNHQEIYDVLDLCLSCKACKAECPSNVDMAKLKGEFLQHYYDSNGVPFRTMVIAYITSINQLGSLVPAITNIFLKPGIFSTYFKKLLGFSEHRSMPLLSAVTLKKWNKKKRKVSSGASHGKVYLFADEFTNYNDAEIGIKAIMLLERLGYEVIIPHHVQSGRTFISKGLLRKAKRIANHNVLLLKDKVSSETPLVGIEPSAILSFRDEYPELVNNELIEDAKNIGKSALLIEEFIMQEVRLGKINSSQFTSAKREILYHGHCQQKAIASTKETIAFMSIPENYSVKEIPSGCCGMAGSFGYEKEHYELSMKVGELVLFPAIKASGDTTLLAASGTSCRHQIKDGTSKKAFHPVEILFDALNKD